MTEPVDAGAPLPRLLYRVEEAATLLAISRSKAYELIYAGEIPHVRIGHSIRVPAEALKEWLDRLATQPYEKQAVRRG